MKTTAISRTAVLAWTAALALATAVTGCGDSSNPEPPTTSGTGADTTGTGGGGNTGTGGNDSTGTGGTGGTTASGTGGTGGTPNCDGPNGCFSCAPKVEKEFLNACTDAQCSPFDDAARLPLYNNGNLPPIP